MIEARWQRMVALAQMRADAGKPVLVVSAGGDYWLEPSKQAVNEVIERTEKAAR